METMVKQPLLQKAIVFAAMKHEGYVRKGTTILETNEVPDTGTWEDITDQVFFRDD